MEHRLTLNRAQFLRTEFGSGLEKLISEWDRQLEERGTLADDKEIDKSCEKCLAQWEVYQLAMKQFFGIEFHFTRTDDYFGVCTVNEEDWLFRRDRYPTPKVVSTQTVTRRGIKLNGQEYWDDDLLLGFLNRKVNVVITSCKILVEDMSGEIITTFTKEAIG